MGGVIQNFRENIQDRREARRFGGCNAAALPDCTPVDSAPGSFPSAAVPESTTTAVTLLPGVTPKAAGVIGPRDARCEEVSDSLHRSKYGKEGSEYYLADGKIYGHDGKYLGEAFVTMSKDGPRRSEELAALKNADHIPGWVMANIDGKDQFIDGSKTSIAIGPPPGTVPTYVSRTRLTRYTNLADGSNVTGDKAAVTEVVYTKPGGSSQPPQRADFTVIETRGDKQIVRHKDGRIARLNGDKLEWLLYESTDTRTNGEREYGAAFWAADPSYNTVGVNPKEVSPDNSATKREEIPLGKEAKVPEPLLPPTSSETPNLDPDKLAKLGAARVIEAEKAASAFADVAIDGKPILDELTSPAKIVRGNFVSNFSASTDAGCVLKINGARVAYKLNPSSGLIEYSIAERDSDKFEQGASFQYPVTLDRNDPSYGINKNDRTAKYILNEFIIKLNEINRKYEFSQPGKIDRKFPENVDVSTFENGEKYLKEAAKYHCSQGLEVCVLRSLSSENTVHVKIGSRTVWYTFNPGNNSWESDSRALFTAGDDKLSETDKRTKEAFDRIDGKLNVKRESVVIPSQPESKNDSNPNEVEGRSIPAKDLKKSLINFMIDINENWESISAAKLSQDKGPGVYRVSIYDTDSWYDPGTYDYYVAVKSMPDKSVKICWSYSGTADWNPVDGKDLPASKYQYWNQSSSELMAELIKIQRGERRD